MWWVGSVILVLVGGGDGFTYRLTYRLTYTFTYGLTYGLTYGGLDFGL